MKRATWNPAENLALPLETSAPTEFDVVGLFDGDHERMAARLAVIVIVKSAEWRGHRFRALTDNLDRATEWLRGIESRAGIIDSLMIGTTIRTQADADRLLPALAALPARWRLVRVEPREAIDFNLHGARVASWNEDVSANMLTGEWWTSPRQDEPNDGVGLDLVIIAGGLGSAALRRVQAIGGQVLDAQRRTGCPGAEEGIPGPGCGICGNTGEILQSGPALAIVEADVCVPCGGNPRFVESGACVATAGYVRPWPGVHIPGRGTRVWKQDPPRWLP